MEIQKLPDSSRPTVFRHDYEDVLPRIVWNTVNHQLSDLEAAVDTELGPIKPT